jgi:hypothetical protein
MNGEAIDMMDYGELEMHVSSCADVQSKNKPDSARFVAAIMRET